MFLCFKYLNSLKWKWFVGSINSGKTNATLVLTFNSLSNLIYFIRFTNRIFVLPTVCFTIEIMYKVFLFLFCYFFYFSRMNIKVVTFPHWHTNRILNGIFVSLVKSLLLFDWSVDTSLCHQITDTFLQIIYSTAHIIDPRYDLIRHWLEFILNILK